MVEGAPAGEPGYPAHWEADVLLSDGATAHLRPITPADEGRLVAFYARVSDRSKYLRFFVPYPRLSERDVERFTHVDHVDRVGLVVLVADEIIAVGRYDRIEPAEAEVAFLVEDAHQGRGLGSVLMEHLAQAGRERGVRRFVAEVLPQNSRMIKVFRDAGYTVRDEYAEGVVALAFPIDPTGASVDVMNAREHRAEARSVARLLTPRSVAVVGAEVGAGVDPDDPGHRVADHLRAAGFRGPVHVVRPPGHPSSAAGVHADLAAVGAPVDLAVVVPGPEAALALVPDAARAGVHGLVVLAHGHGAIAADARAAQVALVQRARSFGMRVVGPNSLGVVNTDPAVCLNASLRAEPPARGPIGFFCQSAALGAALLDQVGRRGLGLSTFVSAGDRADVSGNDLLQYWADDAATEVVLLYLETLGNPRKFARVARELGRRKPVVAVTTVGTGPPAPTGPAPRSTAAPAEAFQAMFRQAGIIAAPTLAELFDTAQVLAHQPLPAGRRVAVVGTSGALNRLGAQALRSCGLQLAGPPVDLDPGAGAADVVAALAEVTERTAPDSVVVLFAALLSTAADEVARAVATFAAATPRTVVASFVGDGVARSWLPGGTVPAFATPEVAVSALARATGYAAWRAEPAGVVPELDRVDTDAARALVRDRRTVPAPAPAPAPAPGAGAAEGEHELGPDDVRALLGCYGIPSVADPSGWPTRSRRWPPVPSWGGTPADRWC